jgi:hypothetical protein
MSRRHPTASEFAVSPYDPIVESDFFRRIVLANGSFKTTGARRLDDLNRAVLPYVQAVSARPVEIMDVASSSGISTQEWYDALQAVGIEARMVGTDLAIEALHLPGKLADVLLDKDLNVIHLSLLGGAMHPRILKGLRAAGLMSAAARLLLTAGSKPQPFRLVSKAVRSVTLLESDIESDSRDFDQRFHVIRVANILNRGYFAGEQLRRMVSCIVRKLRPAGLLIVCRTHDDKSNHATIFRLERSRLKILRRLGCGSEVEALLAGAS